MTLAIKKAGLVAAALALGMVSGLLLRPRPVPPDGAVAAELSWQLPALSDASAVAKAADQLRAAGAWSGAGQVDESEGLAAEQAEAERLAAEQTEAARAANTWRFVGSIEQGVELRAVFRAGDGRARRIVAGEEIEDGARLVELHADSAVIELPERLRAQNELPQTKGPVRLQLFRDTEFSLYVEEE